jgi:hypothetical protein
METSLFMCERRDKHHSIINLANWNMKHAGNLATCINKKGEVEALQNIM